MLNIDNKTLCELCFAKLPPKIKKCPYCGGEKNIIKYPTSLPEGTILVGRYSVGKVLGKGGFGITYLCYDLKEKKKVAIKEYLPDTLAHRNSGETAVTTYDGEQEEFFKNGANRFYEEAKLVSRFNGNPNIISVYEFFYENNTTYFVMEYLAGMDLKRYLKQRNGKISEGEAVYIANRIADALMIVHSADILHRDLSPDNIFICENGDVKLIDFGAARQIMASVSKSLSVIIKHGFAPFEQYQRKGKQGPWTDIYALGATIYLAVTGNMLDDAMSRFDDDTLDFKGITPEFAAILEHMLKVDREDRYQNIPELKNDLNSLNIERVVPEIKKKEEKNFCEKCGKEIFSDETLCENCKKLSDRSNEKDKNKKTVKILIPLCSVIVVIAVVVSVFFALSNHDIGDESDWISADSEQIQGVEWKYENGTLTVYGNGAMKDYKEGEAPWLEYNEEISSIVIENGITSIGNYAFYNCFKAKSITIPETVTNIGYRSFELCRSLPVITIPKSVTIIENYAFTDCYGLVNVTIPGSVKSVGDHAFTDCYFLREVIIENNKKNISLGSSAFPKSTKITYAEWKISNGVLTVLGDGILEDTDIENRPWNRYIPDINEIIISEGVTAVGEYEFKNYTSITKVTFPNSMTSIPNGAFYGCSALESITIPETVTKIGEYSFRGCVSLTELFIPSNVKTIGSGSFYGCVSLGSVIISDGVETIESYAFYQCDALTEIEIPKSVTTIGSSAIFGCKNFGVIRIHNKKENIDIGSNAFNEQISVVYDE